jgi:hypothetical protein
MDEEGDEVEGFCHICSRYLFHDEFDRRREELNQIILSLSCQGTIGIHGSFEEGKFYFNFNEMSLEVVINLNLKFPIQARIENRTLSRKVVDAIRVSLRIYLAEIGPWYEGNSMLDITVAVLQLVEETTAEFLARHTPVDDESLEGKADARFVHAKGYTIDSEEDHYGSSYDHPLSLTPKQICEKIAPSDSHLRVVHCENVIRSNLRRAFLDKQEDMRIQLEKLSTYALRQNIPQELRRSRQGRALQREEMIDHLVKPRLTFHGTRKDTVASIVRHGFIKPGTQIPGTSEKLEVRCGNTYGRGIYSSPDPNFSLSYSEYDAHQTTISDIPGQKLIVCATLMGRTAQMSRHDNWRYQDYPYSGADSHAGNNNLEYIVFSAAQILPCYVIHLDWGESPSRTLQDVNARANNKRKDGRVERVADENALYPGERQRLKEERMAQASKFFAYGFGPISGKNIVVEDIGDIDDDEEEYGEYQAERTETNYEANNVWDWKPNTGSKYKDQYTTEKKAKVIQQ